MNVTQKSPKHFRFTFITRLQNLSLNVIENIYRANDILFGGKHGTEHYAERLEYQRKALTDIRVLAYFAFLSMEQQCILPKQYEQISKLSTDCQLLPTASENLLEKIYILRYNFPGLQQTSSIGRIGFSKPCCIVS